MNTFDDEPELGFFEEPQTRETARRPRRRTRSGGDGPRRPGPPPGTVGLARLAGLIALGIAIVVGFVFWVGSCQGGSKHSEYSSYLGKIMPLAQSSAHIGQELANELDARNLTLPDLETKLKAWSQQEQQDYAAAQRIQPPGPLQSAHAHVLDVFQLRALALTGIADTLAQAKSKSTAPPTGTIANDLAAQAQLLSASDIVWTELFRLPTTETLSHQGVTGVIVPASQFVTDSSVIASRNFAIVYGRLGSGTTAGGGASAANGLHGSALIGATAVEAGQTTTLSETSLATVPVSSGLVVNVTFEDSGNFPEVKIPVTLDVVVSGKKVFTKTQTVDTILPKHQATVSFSGLQVPPRAFGHSSEITVKIGQVPGEVRLDNNSATYRVLFSLAPS